MFRIDNDVEEILLNEEEIAAIDAALCVAFDL